VEGNLIGTSASIGFAIYPEDGTDIDSLRAVADKAMYAAKHARNQPTVVELFHPAEPVLSSSLVAIPNR
jgi:GGDEF domain-containing protein